MNKVSLILTDRSRIEADWLCPRKRYWLTEYRDENTSTGLVPASSPPAFTFGLAVHEGIEAGIKGETAPDISEADMTDDQKDCVTAIVTGFFEYIWPQWMTDYEPVVVEQELEFEHDGVLFMCRPDLILKHKRTGDHWYPDFKTFSGSFNYHRWAISLQQQLTFLACKKALDLDLAGAWIQGLGKGSGRKGTLYHPLVFGYRHPGVPGVSEPTYGVQRRTGFQRFNTKEYHHNGVKGWIQQLMKKQPDMVAKVYPQSQPIFPQKIMDGVLEQITYREQLIAKTREPSDHKTKWAQHMGIFPQHISQCDTGWGQCSYFDMCHVSTIHKNPIGSGSFVPREPHHAAENTMIQMQDGD